MTERDIIDIAMQPGLSELKLHLRITSSDQDALLLSYLKAAALSAEHHIGRCLLQSRFTYTGSFKHSILLDKINTRFFPLMGTPTVEVDGKKTTDFTVKGRTLTFSEGVTGDRVKIVYVGGGHKIEADIKAAILLTASKYFNNPVDSVETLPSVATNLLGQYRSWGDDDGEQD